MTLTHEVIVDPSAPPRWPNPAWVAVARASLQQYHVDPSAGIVHVLDADGQRLHELRLTRGEAQEAMAWQPWLAAVTPSGAVAVYDRQARRLELFDSMGNHLGGAAMPFSARIDLRGLEALSEDLFAFSGPILSREYFGRSIHIFRLMRSPFGLGLAHESSFAETPYVDPAIYAQVGGGRATLDADGGLLYAQRTPYSTRKYTQSGQELWRIDDAELIPSGASVFGVTPEGRLEMRLFSYSLNVLPLGQGLYLHLILEPPEGSIGALRMPPGAEWRRIGELIRSQGSTIERITFPIEDPLTYITTDTQGRLYGAWEGRTGKLLIRSSVSFDETSVTSIPGSR